MPQPIYEQLVEIIAEKDRHIAKLQARVTQLEARIAQLEQLLERATRARKHQAASFSKGTPKPDPKTPGRKPGKDYGPKAHRPLPEQQGQSGPLRQRTQLRSCTSGGNCPFLMLDKGRGRT